MTTKLLKIVAAHQLLHPKRRGAFGSGGIDRRPIEVHCGEVAEGKRPQPIPEQKSARN